MVVKQSYLKGSSHHDGTPVKMLINEMCNRENTKRDEPNFVSRLMGAVTLPPETGPTIHVKECFDGNSGQHAPRMPQCESTKVDLTSLPLTTFKQSEEKLPLNCKMQYSNPSEKLPLNCKMQYSDPSNKSLSSAEPYRREHPQEEQLQKFKRQFEAWQESKLWELSSNLDCNSRGLKNKPILALENLNMHKMAGFTSTDPMQKKPIETEAYFSVNNLKINHNRLHGFQHDGSFGKELMLKTEDDVAIRRELAANSFEPTSRAKFQEKRSTPYSPTRIVILKASSDMKDKMEEPRCVSPEVLEKGSRMEDFLKEVKERLRLEIEGKGRNDSIRSLSASRTSLHESSTDPKQLAWEVEKHGATLGRSESMRSFRNELHLDGHESSDSIRRDARKSISDRLKNVLKDDSELKKPILYDGRAGKSLSIKEKSRSKSVTAYSKKGKDASFWEDKKAVNESIPKHLRHEQVKRVPLDTETMSPPNLFRCAPISRSSFRKSLLEDNCVPTEAQNFRKHEASKNDSAVVKKSKKDGFSIKNTISNLRRNLGLRGKFFGKKVPSMGESTVDMVHYVMPNEIMPSDVRNFGGVQNNSTEVPPSPASFPCSPINEHYSPVSPLEVSFVDDYSSSQVSGELSMTLSGSQTEHIANESCGMETDAQLYDSNETDLMEGRGEAYVRDILVVSGLYRAWPLDKAISMLAGQVKPISSWVFDEVEEKCRKLGNVDDDYAGVNLGGIEMDRKMLFDLINEALPSVIGAPMTRLMSKRLTRNLTQLPHGRQLLSGMLHQIQIYTSPKFDQPQSINKMVLWDVKLMPCLAASHEDISSLGRELEWLIMRELIDDLVSDLLV